VSQALKGEGKGGIRAHEGVRGARSSALLFALSRPMAAKQAGKKDLNESS